MGWGAFLIWEVHVFIPRACPQPIKEEYLLTGALEKTNEAYALAKIAGLEMCRHYRNQYGVLYHSAMPTNLYGPGDNYEGKIHMFYRL